MIPGHGGPIDSAAARRLLAEDRDYLEALRLGAPAASALPAGRRDGEQRRLHAANLAALTAAGAP